MQERDAMSDHQDKVEPRTQPKRKPGRPRGVKSKVKQAARNAIAGATSEEEKQLVRRLTKLTKGDGGVAFNAIRFLLLYRHDWETKKQTVPAQPKPEKLGKKEQAMRDAQTAHEDSPEWADLLH